MNLAEPSIHDKQDITISFNHQLPFVDAALPQGCVLRLDFINYRYIRLDTLHAEVVCDRDKKCENHSIAKRESERQRCRTTFSHSLNFGLSESREYETRDSLRGVRSARFPYPPRISTCLTVSPPTNNEEDKSAAG